MTAHATVDADLATLQLAVPAVDPLLDQLRAQLPRATVLSPGHVSLGYPWLPPADAAARIDAVAAAVGRLGPLPVTLVGPERFPPDGRGRVTLHLVPDPPDRVHQVADAVADAADHRPERFTPHCSLVRLRADSGELDAAARLVAAHAPLRARFAHLELRVRRAGRWSVARRMGLGGE